MPYKPQTDTPNFNGKGPENQICMNTAGDAFMIQLQHNRLGTRFYKST